MMLFMVCLDIDFDWINLRLRESRWKCTCCSSFVFICLFKLCIIIFFNIVGNIKSYALTEILISSEFDQEWTPDATASSIL